MFSIPALDDRSPGELQETADRWFREERGIASDPVVLDQMYNLILPRNIFFKSLPMDSEVLDVGAGDGSFAVQKRWPLIERPDLRLFALSLDIGAHFDQYEAYEIKNFETDPEVFGGRSFDAIVCAHFIEHMAEPAQSIEFFARKLRSGGRLYIEWPHAFTKKLPTRASLADQGVDISTFNFFDDQTHIDAWRAEKLARLFEANGFAIETGGRIYLPWIGEQMRDHARYEEGNTRLTLGAWAAFGWAQYLVVNRI
jgi:2-polyprenyl-3-methyl-5-hydroxy-6-metoxy-1,4-benzoquinol methylase